MEGKVLGLDYPQSGYLEIVNIGRKSNSGAEGWEGQEGTLPVALQNLTFCLGHAGLGDVVGSSTPQEAEPVASPPELVVACPLSLLYRGDACL